MIELNKLCLLKQDEQENMQLLNAACAHAQRHGVTELVLTQRLGADELAQLQTDESWFTQLAADWPTLKLQRGFEWLLAADLPRWLQRCGITPTIKRSRYLLLGLPSLALPQNYLEIIRQLVADGYAPIIVRPECCRVLRRAPQLVTELVEHGCLLQLEARSLLGGYTPELALFARKLLEAGQAHFLTTRASVRADVNLRAACAAASQLIGRQAARRLVLDNPRAVLANAALPAEQAPARCSPALRATFDVLAAQEEV